MSMDYPDDEFVKEDWLKSGDEQCGCCPGWCCCRGSSPSDCQWWKIRITSTVSLCVNLGLGIRDQLQYPDPDSNLYGAFLAIFVFKIFVLLRGNFNAWKKTRFFFYEYLLWMIMFVVLNIGYVVSSIANAHVYSNVLCLIPQLTFKGCMNATLSCLQDDSCSRSQLVGSGCQALTTDACDQFRIDKFDWSYVVLQIVSTAGTLLPLVPVLQLLTATRKQPIS